MKVALVHDWLVSLRGGERVLQTLLSVYPQADVHALFHQTGRTTPQIDGAVRGTSTLNALPAVDRYYRYLLPLYPFAAKTLRLEGYDLVVSISHAAAKNVTIPRGTEHLCYCLTPMRYIWDEARAYFGSATPLVWPLIKALRGWDRAGAAGVTRFSVISNFVAARVRRFYGRESTVIYPPVDTSWIESGSSRVEGAPAFLCAGALVPYKKIDVAVRVCSELGLPLWVAGTGPEERKLKRMAGSSVKFLGSVSDQELAALYRSCRALIFPGKEDFGMMPIECLAAGSPVIGLYAGALRETLPALKPWAASSPRPENSELCGVFISPRGNVLSNLAESLKLFVKYEAAFDSTTCKARARHFGVRRFIAEWLAFERRESRDMELDQVLARYSYR